MNPKQKKPQWRRIAISLVLPALFVLGLEGVTRLVMPRASPIQFMLQRPPDPGIANDTHVFKADSRLGWKLKPNLKQARWEGALFSTNAGSLRHDGPLGSKSPETMRIVCLGDSVTFGYGVPYAKKGSTEIDPDHLPFPRLIEKRLHEDRPQRDFQVIALAVPAYSSRQGLVLLRRDIESLEPDLVIATFGWNDVQSHSLPDSVTFPDETWRLHARRLVGRSQAMIYLSRVMGRMSRLVNAEEGKRLPRVSQSEYISNMLEIAELARSASAGIVLLGQVYSAGEDEPEALRVAAYRRGLESAARTAGLAYLGIEELTEKGYPENQALFLERIHPNHLGHALMAERIVDFLNDEGLLDS